jgi:uncharacterized membrane protein (UPF0136 family)
LCLSEKNKIIGVGIGVWASGVLVGANAIGLLPIEPSLPPVVLLAIGVIATIGSLAGLYRTAAKPHGG